MRYAVSPFAVNPPWADLPRINALLNGYVRTSYIVDEYETTLSIKAVVSGEAWYTTPNGRYRVTPDVFLILNDGQRYAMDADAGTETLCPFFAPGFLAGALHARTTADERLLDEPEPRRHDVDFVERLHPMADSAGAILLSIYRAVRTGGASQPVLEDGFHQLAAALVALRDEDRRRAAAFPAVRHATREELYRRLCRARDFLASSYAEPVGVADAASVAALSPFHFHRSFKAAFGVSPMQFLQQRRLEIARDLLKRGHRVTDVVAAVGFESHSSFTALFRRRFGIAPREVAKSRIEEASAVATA